MLSRLAKTVRRKAAVTIAVLYALCILAPSAVLALNSAAAHCLTDSNSLAHVHQDHAKAHVHSDGATDQHHTHHDDKPHKHSDAGGGNCCGLFCSTALPSVANVGFAELPTAAKIDPVRADALTGRAPDRINRPPIA